MNSKSLKNYQRMKTNPIKYITNVYPLIDKKLSRTDCLNWINKQGYPTPPRSACTFCPFHSTAEWREIKNNKEEWAEVVAIDKAIRNQEKFKDKNLGKEITEQLYLHRSCKPIDEINFNEQDKQQDLFYGMENECEGYCGN